MESINITQKHNSHSCFKPKLTQLIITIFSLLFSIGSFAYLLFMVEYNSDGTHTGSLQ